MGECDAHDPEAPLPTDFASLPRVFSLAYQPCTPRQP